jgi:uncharacterized protein
VEPRRSLLPALAGLLLLACAAGLTGDAGTPIPAAPQRYLTDEAGFLSAAAASELDARLAEYERSSNHQLIVYIGGSTGGVPLEEWAARAFESWRVGRRGLDDGAAVFIMAADKRVRIEVGYGLEDKVTDALAGRIIHDDMAPRLQQGDNDGAVRAAVDRLTAAISGEGAAAGEAPPAGSRPLTFIEKVLIGIGVLFFIVLLITNPSLAIYLLFSILSGGRGGGGGGRGGFMGGGGRSGGGGASGGW